MDIFFSFDIMDIGSLVLAKGWRFENGKWQVFGLT